ncbi:peptidase [Sphingobacteriaceae bacterium]|nr:peptidase [Sphingobacteriaceae bacterium]
MNYATAIAASLVGILIVSILYARWKRKKELGKSLSEPFPEKWTSILEQQIVFYQELDETDKKVFKKRVQLFIATKVIKGVDIEISDEIKLMVASSAVIPTFAFTDFNYPNVHTVLIYPNSFDSKFQTERYEGHEENISGMVDGSFSNSTVILSKPDLVQAFDGLPHKENVGIHEFVHLLDKDDGVIDGIPELLINKAFVAPWLHLIKNEITKIEKGNSDINPYALTNNSEFLAVVGEYFFNNPEKFKRKHPELFEAMSKIFNRK